jgi:hypothetical protein
VPLTSSQAKALEALLGEYAGPGEDLSTAAKDALTAASHYDDDELYYPDQPHVEGLFNLLEGFGTTADWRVVEGADDDALRRHLEGLAHGVPEPGPAWGIPRRDNLQALKWRLLQ